MATTNTSILQIKLTTDGTGKVRTELAGVVGDLQRMQPAANAAGGGASNLGKESSKAASALEHLNVNSAGTRRELGYLLKDMATGQTGRFEQSFATLASRMGLVELAFSATGAAVLGFLAVIGGGIALMAAAEAEEDAFNEALLATGGYAGLTTKQLEALTSQIGAQTGSYSDAQEALTQLTATGRVTADALADAAHGSVEFAQLTGKSVGQAAAAFVKLRDDPLAASVALSASLHYLTAAEAEQIAQLQSSGNEAGAFALAVKDLNAELDKRHTEYVSELGVIAKTWLAIKTNAGGAMDSAKTFFHAIAHPGDFTHDLLNTARMAQYSGGGAGALPSIYDQQTRGAEEAAARSKAAEDAVNEFVNATVDGASKTAAALKEQIAVFGEGKLAVEKYKTAQLLSAAAAQFSGVALEHATAGIRAQRAPVEAAAAALDKLGTASKSAAKYQAQLTADKAYIQQLQAQRDLLGASTTKQILYNAALHEAAAANDADREAIAARADALVKANLALDDANQLQKVHSRDQAANDAELQHIRDMGDLLRQVEDRLDPAPAAWDEYIKTMRDLDAVDEATHGHITSVTDALREQAKQVLDNKGAMADYEQNLSSVLTSAHDQLYDGIADAMVNGVQDGGKKLLEMTHQLIEQVAKAWLEAKIIAPIEERIRGTGSGPSGGDALIAGGMFLSSVVGSASGGSRAGAALAGAVGGASAGATFGWVGAIVGAVIGAIGGWMSSKTPKPPEFTVDTNQMRPHHFTTSLGKFGLSDKHAGDADDAAIEEKIQQFDEAIAQFLPADQVKRVQDAIAAISTRFEGSDPIAVEQAHLDAVLDAVMPQFRAFIDGIGTISDELKAFQSLSQLEKDLKSTQSVIVQLAGTPLEKLQDQLKNLTTNVTDAKDKLAAAERIGDPTQMLAAEQALKQAVIARYQMEIQSVQNLLAVAQQLEQSSYTLRLSLANAIAGLTGDYASAVQVTGDRVAALKDEVTKDMDFGDALNKLNEFTGAVNDWLSAATAQVHSEYDAQIQALEDQKAALQSTASSSQIYEGIQESLNKRAIKALQEQLALAQQWLAVLNSAKQEMQDLQTGNSNPLGGFSQLDMLNQIIAQTTAAVNGETGKQQAADAQTLLAQLQQRLQLIQSGNLYDRSSPEYLASYNATLAQIAAIEALAQPEADQVDDLQKQLDALQNIQHSVTTGFTANSAALAEINKKEEALRAQEKEQLDDLNKQALDYYTWAQGEEAELEEKRHKEIVDQLNAITGGVDPTQFIANESKAMAASLDSIDQQIKDFLDSISSGNYSTGGGSGGGSGGGGPGGPGRGPPDGVVPAHGQSVGANPNMAIHITVNGTGMGAQDIATAVHSQLSANIGPLANALKRELKVA